MPRMRDFGVILVAGALGFFGARAGSNVLGPELGAQYTTGGSTDWPTMARDLWLFTVRPIAVGGMLVGALYTLFKMRDKLVLGAKRGVADLKKSAGAHEAADRTDQDLSFKTLLTGILLIFLLMIALAKVVTTAFSLPASSRPGQRTIKGTCRRSW